MKKELVTTIQHPGHSSVFIVRTEYELDHVSKRVTYQSFIEGESQSRLKALSEFLMPQQRPGASILPVLAQHHKLECHLWAIDWEAVALYGLRNPIEYRAVYSDGTEVRLPT